MKKKEKPGYTSGIPKCNQNAFAKRLRSAREKAGFSQKLLAEKVGVSTFSIQEYERGNLPKGDNLYSLSEVLGCSIDWLLTGRGGDPENDREVEEKEGKIPADDQFDFAGYIGPLPGNSSILQSSGRVDRGLSQGGKGQDSNSDNTSLAKLVTQTIEVLESDTIYRNALAANIQAFHASVITEKELAEIKGEMGRMEFRMEERFKKIEEENRQLRRQLKGVDNDQPGAKAANSD